MKITKTKLKQIISEEVAKLSDEDLYKRFLTLEMFGTSSAEADKAGGCAAKGGTWDEEQGKCIFGEKNDPSDIEANLRRADDARQRALAAAKAVDNAEKEKSEAHEALNEQELAIDGMLEQAKTDIEETLNGLSDELTGTGLGEDAVVDVLNLLLTRLIEHVEQGHVGPPA